MDVSAGDRLVLESEKVGQPPRAGTVEEVLCEEPLRVRVRWENGSVTTLSPEAGAARVEPAHAEEQLSSAARP
ncbi:MAG TPA: DUF1918 domain-containing protein [Gaiellaceae bacterium]|nr:DUF1918 domain-containing protein [Gaiellaceae bacterium]